MISVYTKEFETPQRFKPKESLPFIMEFLGHFLGRPMFSSEIIYSSKGKPSIVDNSFNFSVSHSDRFLAVACSKEIKVGLDIQKPMNISEKVLKTILTESESSQSQWVQKKIQFLDVWCIKEASLKLIGHGLSLPLTSLDISFDAKTVEAGPHGLLRYEKLELFSEVTSYLVFDQIVKSDEIILI